MLTDASKELLRRHQLADEESESLPDVIIPTTFNFPQHGEGPDTELPPLCRVVLGSDDFLDGLSPFRGDWVGELFWKCQCSRPLPARHARDTRRYVRALSCHERHQLPIRNAHCSHAYRYYRSGRDGSRPGNRTNPVEQAPAVRYYQRGSHGSNDWRFALCIRANPEK